MSTATCHDCRGRFDRDTMHLIKADTLSRRARICDPCHRAEVERITKVNLRIRADRAEAALARVRALADQWERVGDPATKERKAALRGAARRLRAALDGAQP